MIGDGGQSGFDAAIPALPLPHVLRRVARRELHRRRHRRLELDRRPDSSARGPQFYLPIISDPVVSRTMFAGTGGRSGGRRPRAWGTMTLAEFAAALQRVVRRLRRSSAATGAARATWRSRPWGRALRRPRRVRRALAGSPAAVSAVERTDGGHVDARGRRRPPAACSSRRTPTPSRRARSRWTRLDSLATNDPEPVRQRHLRRSGEPEPGLGVVQRLQRLDRRRPGHVFEVDYNPARARRRGPILADDLGDLPITDVVLDDVTGDLYASTDFGVFAAGGRCSTVDVGGPGHAERRGRRADDWSRAPDPLRRDARAQRLAPQSRLKT